MAKRKQHSIAKRAATAVIGVEVFKALQLAVQSVIFSKDRFLSFEKAAQKAEEMGLDVEKFEERADAFVFDQCHAGHFKDMSLRTIELESGIKAVIGVSCPINAPELPHDSNAVSQDKKPAGTIQNQDVTPVDKEPEMVEVSAEDEIAAFDEVEQVQTLGYVFMSEDESEKLTELKDEFAAQLQALKVVTQTIAHPTTTFLDQLIEKSDEENQVLTGLIDRVNTGLVLLDEAVEKLSLPVEVSIDKGLEEEIATQSEETVVLALKTLQDVLAPVIELFDDTSFERFHSLCKSVNLSSTRLIQEFLNVDKALVPADSMSRDELKESQKQRSDRFGIEIVDGTALTFPKGFPTDLADYGDPVNLKFPIESVERARNARVRFKQFADEIYEENQSKAVVHERIVRRELEFGISVQIEEGDPLDELLPEDLRNAQGVTVVEAGWKPGKEEKVKKLLILKQLEEQQTALGIVLEPDVVDLHGDTYDEESVIGAAWFFMEEMQNMGKNHTQFVNDKVAILESYTAPTDLSIDTPMGLVKIKKNTWLMRVRIKDKKLWEEVKTGELTGFSIGALVTAENLETE